MEAFLANHRERLTCDLAVSADGLQWSPDQPQIEVGARGMVALQIDVQAPVLDVPSQIIKLANREETLCHILRRV